MRTQDFAYCPRCCETVRVTIRRQSRVDFRYQKLCSKCFTPIETETK